MPDEKKMDLKNQRFADLMAVQLVEGYRDGTEAARLFDELIKSLSGKLKMLHAASDPKDILLANTLGGLLRSAKTLKERCLKVVAEEEEKKKKAMEERRRARFAAYYYVESVKLARNLAREPIPLQLGAYTYGPEVRKVLKDFQKKWDTMTMERWKEIGKDHGIRISDTKIKNAVANEWELWEHMDERAAAKKAAPKEEAVKEGTPEAGPES